MRIRQAPAENLLHTFPELSHIGVSDIDNISSIFNFMSLCILYTSIYIPYILYYFNSLIKIVGPTQYIYIKITHSRHTETETAHGERKNIDTSEYIYIYMMVYIYYE